MPDISARCPVRPHAGLLWRMLDVRWQRDSLSGEGARRYGGRWNMKGWPALYLSTDFSTAINEYQHGVHRPGTLVPYRIESATIVDLTGAEARADDLVAAALTCDWKTIALIEGQVPACWELAQQLIASGAEGALVPSAQRRDSHNLVLWRWRAAGAAGEGAALTLLDPDRVLAGDTQ